MDDLHVPDLDAYCRRIGYDGLRKPHPGVLCRVAAYHAAAIPFENLDVLMGRGISLNPQDLEAKIVVQGRGGYCFETNQLLMWALSAMGFKVSILSARVRWKMPRSFTPPRTHMFLCVVWEGEKWLVDCGVGGVSLTGGMRWEDGLIQKVGHDERRVVYEAEDRKWFHQIRVRGDWMDVSEFTGEEMPPIDRVLANWWTSTHPESKFRRNLIVARAGQDGVRRSLLNLEFTVRVPGAEASKREVSSQKELEDILVLEFLMPRGEVPSDLFVKVRALQGS